jgi:hypothetical protein
MAHQHYKGTGQMHSFRGLLADGGEDKIRIEGATGEIAWRITKFQLFPNLPGTTTIEAVVSVWRESGKGSGTTTAVVDFTDAELLAVAFHQDRHEATYIASESVVFDNALFSRNIYVTLTDTVGTESCNYFLELEEVKVSAAGMAQLAVAAARRT